MADRIKAHIVVAAVLAAAFIALPTLAAAGTNTQPDLVAFVPLIAKDDRVAALAALSDYLKPIARSLAIERCAIVLGRNIGTAEAIYTAACKIRRGGWVVMCGDTGIGEFALTSAIDPAKPRSAAAVPSTLIDFAKMNCPGG